MPRRLLAAMAAILLVAGQAGSALAAATAAKGAAGPAASAPIQKGLLGDLASGKADQLRRRVLGEGRPPRRREGQGPHRPRQVRPRHADGERPQVAGRRPGAREQVGHQGEELLALQRDDRPGHREAGPGVRESEGRHRGARREDLPARQAGPDPRSSIQPAAATPSGASRRSARPGPGPRASSARASSSPASTPASTSPTPRSSTSTAATTATARSPTTTTGGTRQASAAASRATTSATAPTRWARWSAATAPARSRPTSASRPARAGSRPRAARTSRAAPRTSLLSSGQWILAPTDLDGNNPDPSKRPDIVNNSWGGGPGDTFYLATVQAWRAAGIIPVFSSGNPGPDCGEGGSPGDFIEVFSAGATDIDDNIADFSGRGPSVVRQDQPRRRRPGRRRHLERPGRRLRVVLRHVDGGAPRRGHDRPGAVGQARAPRRPEQLRAGDRRRPLDRGQPPRRSVRRRRRRRPEQRLRRRPDRREGRGRPRRHRRDARRARSPTRRRRTRSAAPRSPRATATATFDAVTDADGNYALFLAAGSYVVTGDRVRLRPADRVRRRRSRPTRRPTRTSPSTRCRGSPSPATSAPPRTARRSRTPASARSARPSRRRRPTPRAPTRLELPIGDYTLHAVGRRLHRAGRGRRSASSTTTSPRTSRCSASSMTSATAAARSRSTGSTPATRPRCTATRSPAGCTCRSTSSSTARPTRRSGSPRTAT